MPRRESESEMEANWPGQATSGVHPQLVSAGRSSGANWVQLPKGVSLAILPSMTGNSALLKAARQGKRSRRGRQRQAKAASAPQL
jgi:hypothetical protein